METSPFSQQQDGNPQQHWRPAADNQLDRKAWKPLRHPVAVPAIAAGQRIQAGQPFARAYSDVLSERGISLNEFIEFIDDLNVACTANPPLQVLNLAGGIAGFIPLGVAQIVSTAAQATAMVGTVTVSKGRTALFLKKANEKLFAPKGLKVEIVKGEELKYKVGLHPGAQLVAPLAESHNLSGEQRRLRALDGYIAPLRFDVPRPNAQANVLDKMSAMQVKRQIAKNEKKAMKARQGAQEKTHGGRLERSESSSSGEEYSDRGRDRGRGRDKGRDRNRVRERERDRDHKRHERDERRHEKDEEAEQANKIQWLLVEDL